MREGAAGYIAPQKIANELLNERGVQVEPTSSAYARLCHLLSRAIVEVDLRALERSQGNFKEHSFDSIFDMAPTSFSVARENTITLEALIKQFEKEPNRQGISQKGLQAPQTAYRAAKEVLGKNKRVGEVSRKECRDIRDLLMAIPKNAYQRFPKLTLKAAAERAQEDRLPGLHPRTINTQLKHLSTLFKYAKREGYISSNPADGLRVGQDDNRHSKSRLPFSVEQLNKIFSAPLYTGCKNDERGYAIPGKERPRRGRFWVPLIALFHGMRENECCQLKISDIETAENYSAFKVQLSEDTDNAENKDDKRIKTPAGHRLVPMHPELIRIGFLEYFEEMKSRGEERVFPDLPLGKNGYYSDPFQKWFGRFLKSCSVYTPRTTFHSFRHNFRDAMREADLSRDVVTALGGWSEGGAEERYGSGIRPQKLAVEISKVKYEGLDLSHLYP